MKRDEAKPEQWDEIFKLGYGSWGDGAPLEQYLEGCRHSSKYLQGQWQVLQTAYGEVVSALIVYSLSDGVLGIGSLATHPEHRQKGFASQLLREVTADLEVRGARWTFLFSDIDPQFYFKFGFVPVPSSFQRWEGSILMVRGAPGEDFSAISNLVPKAYF